MVVRISNGISLDICKEIKQKFLQVIIIINCVHVESLCEIVVCLQVSLGCGWWRQ